MTVYFQLFEKMYKTLRKGLGERKPELFSTIRVTLKRGLEFLKDGSVKFMSIPTSITDELETEEYYCIENLAFSCGLVKGFFGGEHRAVYQLEKNKYVSPADISRVIDIIYDKSVEDSPSIKVLIEESLMRSTAKERPMETHEDMEPAPMLQRTDEDRSNIEERHPESPHGHETSTTDKCHLESPHDHVSAQEKQGKNL